MMRRLKKEIAALGIVAVLGTSTLSFVGCADAPGTVKGAGVGAVGGAAAGAMIDKKNPWRGAIIGTVIGTVVGGAFGKIADDAAARAARENREVTVKQGNTVVTATPLGPSKHTHCKKVRKRIWKNGKLVMDRIEEVCHAEKEANEY